MEAVLSDRVRWLDLGCGHYFVPQWLNVSFPTEGRTVVGVDLDHEALRKHPELSYKLIANGERLPFRDAAFDLITMNMVLEHVEDPRRLLSEIARILVPGGRLLLHTPNSGGYTTALTQLVPESWRTRLATLLQGRQEEDVYRTYYRANTERKLRDLAQAAGLSSRDVRFVNTSPLFVNVLPLLVIEMLFIALINVTGLHQWRACLLAEFEKP